MAKFLQVDTRQLERMASDLGKVSREAERDWARQVSSRGQGLVNRQMNKGRSAPQDVVFGRARVSMSGGRGTVSVPVTPVSGGLAGRPPYGWELVDFGSRRPRKGRRLPRHKTGGRIVSPALAGFHRWIGAMAERVMADTIRDATGGA